VEATACGKRHEQPLETDPQTLQKIPLSHEQVINRVLLI
jgi:hypothetical protein